MKVKVLLKIKPLKMFTAEQTNMRYLKIAIFFGINTYTAECIASGFYTEQVSTLSLTQYFMQLG